MKTKLHLLTVLAVVLFIPQVNGAPSGEVHRMSAIVRYVPQLKIDASLSAPEWKLAVPYKFAKRITAISDVALAPEEGSEARLLYDDKFLYVGAKTADSDVIDNGTSNQTHLYLTGDLIEVFIKPKNHKYYWEIYGTPKAFTTNFYFPSRGRLTAGVFDIPPTSLPKVEAVVYGTLNNWQDKDKGWNVLIAIPLSELRKNGLKFINSEEWTIFISRYNYSRYLPEVELSSYPQILPSFHLHEYYANLIIEPKGK